MACKAWLCWNAHGLRSGQLAFGWAPYSVLGVTHLTAYIVWILGTGNSSMSTLKVTAIHGSQANTSCTRPSQWPPMPSFSCAHRGSAFASRRSIHSLGCWPGVPSPPVGVESGMRVEGDIRLVTVGGKDELGWWPVPTCKWPAFNKTKKTDKSPVRHMHAASL